MVYKMCTIALKAKRELILNNLAKAGWSEASMPWKLAKAGLKKEFAPITKLQSACRLAESWMPDSPVHVHCDDLSLIEEWGRDLVQ